ncbi:MAG: right-handed parallel beta-helix repeat-containing protein [Candidatus Wolfebacteria bacterium]|nr:right-handed parallel beta-helix repeat-containing protein [Candidatus Wolfebacteria bacterium]
MNFQVRNFQKFIIFLAIFTGIFGLIFIKISQAANYYVDNSGSPVCNNSSSYGTESNPWCTIQYGISIISGGDNLIVKNGTYNESFTITGPSGNSAKSTEIKAYSGHTPKLLGNGINTGRMKFSGVSYMNLSGFEITNYNQGIWIENSDHMIIENSSVHHVGQDAVSIHNNSSYITIQNNLIHDTRQWQYNGEGIYIGTGSGGLQDNTNNILVKNNTIYNIVDEAIELKPGTHDITVDGNLIYNTPDIGATVGAIEVNQSNHTDGKGWDSNPNHIIKNNIIHTGYTAIRAGTGSTIYNNLIYNINANHYGIYVDNLWAGDSGYARKIYHNTIDMPNSKAVYISAGTTDVKNNIGLSIINNIATSDSYYINKANGNYHLVTGAAPIDAGLNLTATVPTDIEGNSRSASSFPDLGAYEYVSGDTTPPAAPTGLSVV